MDKMDFLLAGNGFSLTGKGLLPGVDVQRRYLWKAFRAEAEQRSGIGQKVFGFSPEFVFAFNPERCSESARNPVRLHPGMVFALPRSTQVGNTGRLSVASPDSDSSFWQSELEQRCGAFRGMLRRAGTRGR